MTIPVVNDDEEGRRARKRRETRERIVVAAARLFQQQGYEATTIDDIANAADVSRRSLFDYFATKEDIAFAHQDDFIPLVRDAMRQRPRAEPWPLLLEHALVHAIAAASTRENIALDALVRATPALGPRQQAKYLSLEGAIADELLARAENAIERRRARLVAAVVATGFRLLSSGPRTKKVDVARELRAYWQTLNDVTSEAMAVRSHNRRERT